MLYRNRPSLDVTAIRDAELYSQAGDFWPTFVTPDDAKRYIDEINAGYSKLDTAIMASTVSNEFKTSWAIQNTSWKTFASPAKENVGWFNTRAVMGQTDRYAEELKNWYAGFKAVGGTPPGPPPLPPGQGVPDPNPTTVGDVTTLALVVGGVAALIIFGPKLARVID